MRQSRFLTTAIALTGLLLPSGCGDSAAPLDGGVVARQLVVLDPPGPDIGLSPAGERTLRVRYSDSAGHPVSGARIQFAIFGDPRGSTLSTDATGSSGDGAAQVVVRAGAASCRFEVRATAEGAKPATFYVEVSDAGFGALALGASYAGSLPESKVALVRYLLYGWSSCKTADPLAPAAALRERTAPTLHDLVQFKALPINQDHAVLAVVLDADARVRIAGCLEIPSSVVRINRQVTLAVPLADLPPRVLGSYALTTQLALPVAPSPGSRPLADALQRWADLSSCPYDPAQLLLDCILDALDGADLLDCVVEQPSPKTQALLAARGSPLNGTSCRGPTNTDGAPSLELQLRTSMATNGPALLGALPALPVDGLAALRQVGLQSTLQVAVASPGGALGLVHRLDAASFGHKAVKATISAASAALPQVVASPVSGTITGWRLAVAQHGFSLRYGRLARLGFGKVVLAPAKLPESSPALVAAIAALVQQQGAGVTLSGCAAIDAIACDAARLPRGCLVAACPAGLAALAHRLDVGFDSVAGPSTDITLEGEAELRDEDGDLEIDHVGSVEAPGFWKVRLVLGPEEVSIPKITFLGTR